MNTKLHAICDSQGRPIDLFVTAGQVSDYIGARALLSGLPNVKWLLGDRGYDADWFREALQDKGIRACIPGRKKRKTPIKYDKRRYKRRNRIERECPDLCVSRPVHAVSDTQASKRSPNIMANWLRAANHSRTFRPSFSKLRMAR